MVAVVMVVLVVMVAVIVTVVLVLAVIVMVASTVVHFFDVGDEAAHSDGTFVQNVIVWPASV